MATAGQGFGRSQQNSLQSCPLAAPSRPTSYQGNVLMIIDCHGHYTTEPKDLHRFPQGADRGRQRQGQEQDAAAGAAEDVRRRDPREHRAEPAQAAAGARHRPDDLLAARLGHGPPHRRRERQRGMVADLQRPDRTASSRSIRRTSSASASCRSRRACRRRTPSRSSSAA